MSVRPILQGDIPALRRRSKAVDGILLDNELWKDLWDTLQTHRGLGLSGLQVGTRDSAIVIDDDEGQLELLNPQLLAASGEERGYESCLSFPDLTLCVPRPAKVQVVATDRFGTPVTLTATGLRARILCHEIDHLNGVLFMDRLTDEELFVQMLSPAEVHGDVQDAGPDAAQEDNLQSVEQAEAAARVAEAKLAIDMIADAAWKLQLAATLLTDVQVEKDDIGTEWHPWSPDWLAEQVHDLEHSADQMQQVASALENSLPD